MKPNAMQIEGAKRVVAKYGRDYGGTGSDRHQNTAVMAVYAILTGQFGKVPGEYSACVEGITEVNIDGEAEFDNASDELATLREKLSAVEAERDELAKQIEGSKTDLESMTISELNAFAETNNIDLTGITKKADIIAAIREFNL